MACTCKIKQCAKVIIMLTWLLNILGKPCTDKWNSHAKVFLILFSAQTEHYYFNCSFQEIIL